MKRKLLLGTLLCFLCTLGFAQSEPDYREKQPYKNWVKLVPKLTDDFYSTREAKRIADNVLLYQLNSGGWPKNIYMPQELTEAEKNRSNQG